MRTTLRNLGTLTSLVFVLALAGRPAPAAADDDHRPTTTILSFDTMIGNPGNGDPANVIRGFAGAGSPWGFLRSVHGVLRSNGQLIVIVRGLVITAGADLDQNPVPQFRAALSCQDPTDPNQGQLFFTELVPATTGNRAGDANIVGRLQLPASCFAPLILVTSPPSASSPDGAWFAVTGF